MMVLDINDLNRLEWAMSDIIGYLSDNSCGDPDCCGGPYYEVEQYDAGVAVLAEYGLAVEPNAAQPASLSDTAQPHVA
jgi:hypothetical protein